MRPKARLRAPKLNTGFAMRSFLQVVLAVLGATSLAAAAHAGPQYVNRDGYALSGYDAVAYHTAGAPAEGSEDFAFEYNGVEWLFASAENRDLFAADPEAYAPAYDGHCAYAMANGRKVRADPEVWSIVDGRLYVNFSPRIQRRWEEDIPGYIADADAEYLENEDAPAANPGRNY